MANLRLDAEQDKRFQPLVEQVNDKERDDFIISRLGSGQSAPKTKDVTPQCIKDLAPKVKYSSIAWQPSEYAFHGQYPRPDMDSAELARCHSEGKRHQLFVTRKYKIRWSQEVALKQVVKTVWKFHSEAKGVTQLQVQQLYV